MRGSERQRERDRERQRARVSCVGWRSLLPLGAVCVMDVRGQPGRAVPARWQ